MNRRLAPLYCALALSGCAIGPGFVPKFSQAFGRYTALHELRSNVPVGALWIPGHGPYGEGASPENLVIEPGLSEITIDNNLQASFTAGFLKFLDLDPSYRSKVTARFGDLSVVRIKDMSKLAEPSGAPRIYAGLKAATITISVVQDASLDIEAKLAGSDLNVVAKGTAGRAHTFTIDGKDMFLAIQVATFAEAQSAARTVRVRGGQPATLDLDGLKVALTWFANGAACEVRATAGDGVAVTLKPGAAEALMLEVPVALDGQLYTGVELSYSAVGSAPENGCEGKIVGALTGPQLRYEKIETGDWRLAG
jgi:hypothetical protein